MAKPPDNVFGRRLQEIRVETLGISNTEDFGDLIGVTDSTVENYEQGRSLPSGETPWRLLALLGPDLYAGLMPHIEPPRRVTLELVEAREGGSARRVVETNLGGTRSERLRAIITLAQEILDGDDLPPPEHAEREANVGDDA